MTNEKLSDLIQQKENIDFLNARIEGLELYSFSYGLPTKQIEITENGTIKKINTALTPEPFIDEEIYKIQKRNIAVQLKSLRQYRAKLISKFAKS